MQKPLQVVHTEGASGRNMSAGALGMLIFLVSLAVLFLGSLVAYVIVRSKSAVWRTAEMPSLPAGLWVSTLVILGVSVAVHAALAAARRNDLLRLKRWLAVTLALGFAFLVGQGLNWFELVHKEMPPNAKSLYSFTFYMLTGLHAVHVIGGLVSLAAVTVFAYQGRYSSVFHRGVTLQAMYWHFLDGAWIVLFGTMLVAT